MAQPHASDEMSSGRSGQFSFDSAGRIFDPTGKRFIPVGVNANGPNWVWSGPTVGQSDKMARWGFNTLRVNTCFAGGCGPDVPRHTTNNNLDALITEYTAKKHVIVLAQMQYGSAGAIGDPARLQEVADWWRVTAARYKDNPYVWFNLTNEPTAGGAEALPTWHRITTTLAAAVRSTGAVNPIVVDGNAYGQDLNDWNCGAIPWQNSAFNTHGQSLQRDYGNVVFSLHVYGQFGGNESWGCTPEKWDARLHAYIDRMQALNLPLIIGETGAVVDKAQEPWDLGGSWNATRSVLRVAPARGIGVLAWHGDAGTSLDLLAPDGHWTEYSDANHPGLTWQGQALRDYARRAGQP